MGLDYNMQLLMSGALNCVQVMGVLSSLWTLDRFGRRNILLLGSVCLITPPLIKGTGVRYLRQYLAACNLTLPASYEALII
ncbi:hypothetical protein COL26b_009595 [Colletotrichum chrysophilum]|uniref:uncharacterized protein n=1 Tax=Colletotrichum chrysophilum TaxID=1836956 RepID=UPI002301265E|nr:uncharacterized protein COL26b_009595 [Colletotrichum chrysophilum]KAJ0371505.1 hypothetical protein COL26b_009595 [Colletotrichum chrysophilum]